MTRRLVLAVAVVAATLTGCVQLPRPVAEVEPPRPALSVAQAQRLQRTLVTTMKVADRTHSPTKAAEVLAGVELQGRTADYDKLLRWGRKLPPFETGAKVLTVASPATADYPQRALVVSTRTPSKGKPENRAVEVFVRTGSGDRWRLVSGVAARSKDLPAPSVDGDGVRTPSPTKMNGFALPGAPAIAAAVADPARHRDRFAQTSSLRLFRADLDALRKDADHEQHTQSVRPLPDQYVFATEGGGALVVSTVRVHNEQKMTDGWYFYFPKENSRRKQYPGEYHSSTDTFAAAYLVVVPAKGKITTAGVSSRWVGDTAKA